MDGFVNEYNGAWLMSLYIGGWVDGWMSGR